MANDAPTTDPAVDYRALLEEERASLSHQLAELGFGDAGGLKYDPNFADSSQVTAERGEAEALAGRADRGPRRGRGGHRPAGRRHLRPLRALRPADRPGPARGHAGRPSVHHLRLAALTR